jgi:hypothetical protein
MRLLITFFIFTASAFLLSCKDQDPVQASEVIDILIKDSVYYADGATQISLIIRIPEDASSAFQKVTLSSNGATFADGTASLVRDLRLKPTDTVYLTAGVVPGKFTVKATAGQAGEEYADETTFTLLALTPDQILKSITYPGLETLTADGEQEVIITTTLGVNATVSLATDKGTLRKFGETPAQKVEFTAIPNSPSQIIFKVGNVPGPHVLQISTAVPKFERLIPFTVNRAHAETIVIDMPGVTIDSAGDKVEVKAILKRNSGKVSAGTLVHFEAFVTGSDTSVGYWDPPVVESTDEQIAESAFYLSPSEIETGESITMRISTSRADGIILSVNRTLIVK